MHSDPTVLNIPAIIIGPILAALGGAVAGVAAALWAVMSGRAGLNLGWAERAESLWEELEALREKVDALTTRLQATERAATKSAGLVEMLRLEVSRLRVAIRVATDLEALKREERRIPTTEQSQEPDPATV